MAALIVCFLISLQELKYLEAIVFKELLCVEFEMFPVAIIKL